MKNSVTDPAKNEVMALLLVRRPLRPSGGRFD
jgi:hypothetical protein